MDRDFLKLYNLILQEQPQKSDTIIWLQGDRYDRGPKTLKLYKESWAPKIVISGNNILLGKTVRAGENNISLEKMYKWLVKRGVKKEDIIIDERSMNTKEQAGHIIDLAKKKNWQRIFLVGSSYHQPRIFLTFLKQLKKKNWNGKIINQPIILDWDDVPGGRDKKTIEFLKEEVEKLKKYKNDIIPILDGIKYLKKPL